MCYVRMYKNICQRHCISRFYEETNEGAANLTSLLVDSGNPRVPRFIYRNKAFPNLDTTLWMFTYGYGVQRRHNSIAIGHVQFASYSAELDASRMKHMDSYSFNLFTFSFIPSPTETYQLKEQHRPVGHVAVSLNDIDQGRMRIPQQMLISGLRFYTMRGEKDCSLRSNSVITLFSTSGSSMTRTGARGNHRDILIW